MTLTLEAIIEDLHAIEGELRQLEKKYQVRSETFYDLYTNGHIEHRKEFIRWVALVETKHLREKQYEDIALNNPDQLAVTLSSNP